MLVLFGRAFLLVFTGKINLEIIIRAVKKYIGEISLIVPLITVVKELNIFFVRSADKGQPIVNLVFRDRGTAVNTGKIEGEGNK